MEKDKQLLEIIDRFDEDDLIKLEFLRRKKDYLNYYQEEYSKFYEMYSVFQNDKEVVKRQAEQSLNNQDKLRITSAYYNGKDELIDLLKKYKNEVDTALKDFKHGKKHSFDTILSNIFNLNDKNIDHIKKYNILACKLCLEEAIEEIKTRDYYYSYDIMLKKIDYISNLIFDFKAIYQGDRKRTQVYMSGMEILALVQEFSWGYNRNNSAKELVPIFMMRMVIEQKIKEVIGFLGVADEENKPIPLALTRIIDYIKKRIDSGDIISPVDFSIIEKINYYTNFSIHTGSSVLFYTWHIKMVELFLTRLCFPQKWENGHIEGSFKLKESYYNDLENDLKEYFKDEKLFENQKIELKLKKPTSQIIK